MPKHPLMLARGGALALGLVLAASLTAAANFCPLAGGDAPACNAARPMRVTVALCAAAAQSAEACADRATGIGHAVYLTRAASEWRKAAMGKGRRTALARDWLAHATVLDERVQDDPDAPRTLRAQAKHDEQLARAALGA